MTKAKCASVASALVTAGYTPSIFIDQQGVYHIVVSATAGIDAGTIETFATNQAVTALVQTVDFV